MVRIAKPTVEQINLALRELERAISASGAVASPGGVTQLSTVVWDNVTDKPSEFPPESHEHPMSEIQSLLSALDGKANINHTHEDNIIRAVALGFDPPDTLTYVGKAVPGSDVAGAVWQISKFVYNASLELTARLFADASQEYSKIWDDRASYSYY